MWLFSLSLSVIGARTQTLKTVKHYPRELVFRISFFLLHLWMHRLHCNPLLWLSLLALLYWLFLTLTFHPHSFLHFLPLLKQPPCSHWPCVICHCVMKKRQSLPLSLPSFADWISHSFARVRTLFCFVTPFEMGAFVCLLASFRLTLSVWQQNKTKLHCVLAFFLLSFFSFWGPSWFGDLVRKFLLLSL